MPFPTLSVKDSSGLSNIINTMPSAGQQLSSNSLPVVVASDQVLVSRSNYVDHVSWDGTSFDARSYNSVIVSVIATPTAARTPQWSPDNTNWFNITGLDLNFATITSLSTNNVVTFSGSGYLRLSGGSGGTLLIGARD